MTDEIDYGVDIDMGGFSTSLLRDSGTIEFDEVTDYRSKKTLVRAELVDGGIRVHDEFSRQLLRVQSYWRRKEKKKARRYQLQKRKQ